MQRRVERIAAVPAARQTSGTTARAEQIPLMTRAALGLMSVVGTVGLITFYMAPAFATDQGQCVMTHEMTHEWNHVRSSETGLAGCSPETRDAASDGPGLRGYADSIES